MPVAGDFRPMPADFADNAWLGMRELKVKYRSCFRTIARWRAELGGSDPRDPLANPPADFAAMAAKSNKTMLKQHYGVGDDRLRTWLRVSGIPAASPQFTKRRQAPDDLAELARTMTVTQIANHYRCYWGTAKRWLEEAGIEAGAASQPVPAKGASGGFVFRGHAAVRQARDMRMYSVHDQAADVLRRERFVVFRCDERGRADQKGAHWRIGNTLLTPDELLARADKYRRKAA